MIRDEKADHNLQHYSPFSGPDFSTAHRHEKIRGQEAENAELESQQKWPEAGRAKERVIEGFA